jgi:hypothetical protein
MANSLKALRGAAGGPHPNDDASFQLMTKTQGAENQAASNEAIESLRRLLEVRPGQFTRWLADQSSLVTESVCRSWRGRSRGGGQDRNKPKTLSDLNCKRTIGPFTKLAAMAGQTE